MQVKKIIVGELETNCYVLFNESCLIIDPGGDFEKIDKFLMKKNLKPKAIILTHAHFDHFGAIEQLKQKYKSQICIHRDDKEILENPVLNGSQLFKAEGQIVKADIIFDENYIFEKDSFNLKVLHTPGHTPGSISLCNNEYLFTGDTLFRNSIGRTDLPGGDYQQIMNSLRKLCKLENDELIVFPGHLSRSTLGNEKRNNSFLQ